MLSLAFVRATQYVYTSPTLLQFGLATWLVPWVWLAGPMSGIVMQPVIGVISDSWNGRFGKRKPFIALGALIVIISLQLFANADVIGVALGDKYEISNTTLPVGANQTQPSNTNINDYNYTPWGLAISATSFWILDFALNVIQSPVQALLTDVAPSEQQTIGNACVAGHLSAGAVLGGLLGGRIPWLNFNILIVLPFMETQIRAMYSLSTVVVLITVAVCLIMVKENINYVEKKDVTSIGAAFKKIIFALPSLPKPLKGLFIIHLFTFYAWFSWNMFSSTWFGTQIMGGDPNADHNSENYLKYQNGVQMASTATSLFGLVSVVYSLLLIPLIKVFGHKKLYFFSQVVQGCSLIATLFVNNEYLGFIIYGTLGISWASTYTIPGAIASVAVQGTADKGLFLATLNLALCVPQIIAALGGSVILLVFDKYAAVLAVGGVVSLIGAVFILIIVKDEWTRPIVSSFDESTKLLQSINGGN